VFTRPKANSDRKAQSIARSYWTFVDRNIMLRLDGARH